MICAHLLLLLFFIYFLFDGNSANSHVFGGTLLQYIYACVQKLNEMGAKRIGFIGIPPIGCVPSQRKQGSRECDLLRNQAAELFNSKMEKEMDRLNAEMNVQDSRFAYGDIYYNVLDIIERHGFYGECTLCSQPLFWVDAVRPY